VKAAATPGTRRWAVCADDYALDGGAVEGIVDLIERGRVTATSALVDSPHWPGAASALPDDVRRGTMERRADVGLHLNLTQSFGGKSSTVWSLPELIARCAVHAIARAPLRAAIARQLDAFENALGRGPDYIDGHQHVHQFAIVRGELITALMQRYPRHLPWLRSTRPPTGVVDPKARTISALGDRRMRDLALAAHFRTTRYLVGVYDFEARLETYWQRLMHWMDAGPDGTVLMCHPASRMDPADPITSARSMEYAALGSSRFLEALATARIALTTGTRLLTPAAPAA